MMLSEEKTPAELLSEEQKRVIQEIKEKAQKRKHAMNPDGETGNEYVK